jgi:hypothetical protein
MRTFALRCRFRKDCGILLASLCLLSSVWVSNARADDVPTHRAARLSFLQGDVTIDHLDNTAGDPAQINMPLSEGARVTTGEEGQAEVEFEDGSLVRVTPNSSLGLSVLNVDAAENFHTQVTILHGLVYAKLHASSKYFYVFDAGGELISPVANSTVRINLDQPPATISVFDGTMQVEHARTPEADGYKKDVRAGESLTGDAHDSSQFSVSQNLEQDSWDEWNRARDQAAADEAATRTTARDGYAGDQGYGWSDLDANGSWYDVPGQGRVWQPTVAQDSDFDPYGYGSWVAYSTVGYVWASGYSWGWTPFRCGSWSYWNNFGWGWSPAAGCGRAGWGIGRGFSSGIAINVVRPPLNYRLPTRPVHEGLLHPIPVGSPVRVPGDGLHTSHETRMIAGVPVDPLRPIGNSSATKGHPPIGSALRSNSGVDHINRQAVPGAIAVTPQTDSRAGGYRPVAPPAVVYGAEQQGRQMRPPPPQQRPGYADPTQGVHSDSRSSQPAYVSRPSPPSTPPQTSRPMPPPSSPPASQPMPPPSPRPMPPPSSRPMPPPGPRTVPMQGAPR